MPAGLLPSRHGPQLGRTRIPPREVLCLSLCQKVIGCKDLWPPPLWLHQLVTFPGSNSPCCSPQLSNKAYSVEEVCVCVTLCLPVTFSLKFNSFSFILHYLLWI